MGELEDAKFNGNSAETALITCKDDLEKVKGCHYCLIVDSTLYHIPGQSISAETRSVQRDWFPGEGYP